MFSFHYLNDAPLLSVNEFPQLDGNINGPALITAPDWIDSPGKYLLYFAHHQGKSIQLAFSDHIDGPWNIQNPAPLNLEASRFSTQPSRLTELSDEARLWIEAGKDGLYPHIASPDIWVDHENQQIRLYYHGRLQNGWQATRVALSRDAITFTANERILGNSYLRIFKHDNWFYAMAMPAQLYRSADGITGFESGPQLTKEPIRHHALLRHHGEWYVFWTRVGDAPERLLVSKLDITKDWRQWSFGDSHEVHRATKSWEGSDIKSEASTYGAIMARANQLRDPAIFEEDGRIYLLYTIAGEQGIAIGELRKT